jgi:hypothetical protein
MRVTTENTEDTERKISPARTSPKALRISPGHFARSPLAFGVFRVFRGSPRRPAKRKPHRRRSHASYHGKHGRYGKKNLTCSNLSKGAADQSKPLCAKPSRLSVCSEYSVVHPVGQQSANLTGDGAHIVGYFRGRIGIITGRALPVSERSGREGEHRDGARTRSRDGCATVSDRQIPWRRRQSQWFLRSRHRRLNCRRRGWCRFFHHSRSPCPNLKQHPLKHRPHSKHNRRLTQDRKSKQQFAS